MFNRANSVIIVLALAASVFADPNAIDPEPPNGTTDVLPSVLLSWTPGDYVAAYAAGTNGNGHHVFFHTKLSYVSGANLNYPLGTNSGHFRSDTNSWSPADPVFGFGALLKPETTYYWRILEANSANPSSPWKGEIWSLTTISSKAAEPVPPLGAVIGINSGSVLDVELGWTPGPLAAEVNGHDLYFGTEQAAVANATIQDGMGVYQGTLTEPHYLAANLLLDVSYYWRVDEFNEVYGIAKGDIWQFATDSGMAKNPFPADAQSGVNPDLSITWTPGFAAAVHDIYLGTDSGELPLVAAGHSGTSYPLSLDLNTTYYWRIDEVNTLHPKSPWAGSVWTFTTDSGKAKDPDPANGQTGVYLVPKPSWTASPRAISHNVYFGTVSPPPFAVSQGSTTYNPGKLTYATTYYWRVDEEQGSGGTTTGDEWSFTTSAGPVDASVVVDQAVQYQTIDGFGAHGAMNVWWGNGPFYNQAFLDRVIDDLGLTIIRNEYYPKPDEPGQWPKQVPYLQALKQKAQQSGEPLKFTATYWTPPSYMKDPPQTDGGRLLPEYYDEFADYVVATIQDYNNAGIDLYALSLQNEPGFSQSYNSCVYTHEAYRDMLKVVGPVANASFPNTKLFMCEHMLEWQGNNDQAMEWDIIQDPQALQWADIWAVHGYGNDGQTPDPNSGEADIWQRAWNRFQPTGRHFWMTETSGYTESWADSQQLGQSVFAALKYGHVSAWVWWQLSERGLGEYTLMDRGTPGKRYYVSKQYYRYIRPEAVMVECNADNEELLAVSFKHAPHKTATIVMINTGLTEKLVQLDITGDIAPPRFHIYRTSAAENCIDAGTVAGDGTFVIPESSIVTLYGAMPHNNMGDFAAFADEWRRSDCAAGNNWCAGADSTQDGSVLLDDMQDFAIEWLAHF